MVRESHLVCTVCPFAHTAHAAHNINSVALCVSAAAILPGVHEQAGELPQLPDPLRLLPRANVPPARGADPSGQPVEDHLPAPRRPSRRRRVKTSQRDASASVNIGNLESSASPALVSVKTRKLNSEIEEHDASFVVFEAGLLLLARVVRKNLLGHSH